MASSNSSMASPSDIAMEVDEMANEEEDDKMDLDIMDEEMDIDIMGEEMDIDILIQMDLNDEMEWD